jgi:hypothetical protein
MPTAQGVIHYSEKRIVAHFRINEQDYFFVADINASKTFYSTNVTLAFEHIDELSNKRHYTADVFQKNIDMEFDDGSPLINGELDEANESYVTIKGQGKWLNSLEVRLSTVLFNPSK